MGVRRKPQQSGSGAAEERQEKDAPRLTRERERLEGLLLLDFVFKKRTPYKRKTGGGYLKDL